MTGEKQCSGLTWPVQELALAHVCDVQSFEKEDQVAEVSLGYSGTPSFKHSLLIQGLGVQTKTHS